MEQDYTAQKWYRPGSQQFIRDLALMGIQDKESN